HEIIGVRKLCRADRATDTASDDLYYVPLFPLGKNEDPLEVAESCLEGINPKRCVFVGTATIPWKAQQMLVYALPVDHGALSVDGTGIDELHFEHGEAFVSLSDVVSDMRNRRSRGAIRQLDNVTLLALGRLAEWCAELHASTAAVRSFWRPKPSFQMRAVVHNAGYTSDPDIQARAPRAVINPLYRSTLLLPMPASPLPVIFGIFALDSPPHLCGTVTCAPVVPIVSASALDENGWSPLHYAAFHGSIEAAKLLMEDWQGGPTIQTLSGSTALHFAAQNGHATIVELLLACPFVDREQSNTDGLTPMQLCQRTQLNDYQRTIAVLSSTEKHALNRYAKAGLDGAVLALADFKIYLPAGHAKVLVEPLAVNLGLCAYRLNDKAHFDMFAIWVISGAYKLQLRQDHFPLRELANAQSLFDQGVTTGQPILLFQRSVYLSLSRERQVVDPVVLKLLFEQALHSYLSSEWPVSLDDSAHLAGLLMQIRFADHKGESHTLGFLTGTLQTFVPAHLQHALRPAEWERRIFEEHKGFRGTLDFVSLHRLFLQFCRQWSFYGCAFYPVGLLKPKRAKAKPEDWTLGFNAEWLVFTQPTASKIKLSLTWNEVQSSLSPQSSTISLTLTPLDRNVLHPMAPFLEDGVLSFKSRQAVTLHALIQSMIDRLNEAKRIVEQKRIEQGGPRVLHHKSNTEAEAPTAIYTQAEVQDLQLRQQRENSKRLAFINAIGVRPSHSEQLSEAERRFREEFGKPPTYRASIKDVKLLCYHFGYWLGSGLDGAREALSATDKSFTFRDFVVWSVLRPKSRLDFHVCDVRENQIFKAHWLYRLETSFRWAQSPNRWLYLLDNEGFSKRYRATEAFRRIDKASTGKLVDKEVDDLINIIKDEGITSLTSRAIQQGVTTRRNNGIQAEVQTPNLFIDKYVPSLINHLYTLPPSLTSGLSELLNRACKDTFVKAFFAKVNLSAPAGAEGHDVTLEQLLEARIFTRANTGGFGLHDLVERGPVAYVCNMAKLATRYPRVYDRLLEDASRAADFEDHVQRAGFQMATVKDAATQRPAEIIALRSKAALDDLMANTVLTMRGRDKLRRLSDTTFAIAVVSMMGFGLHELINVKPTDKCPHCSSKTPQPRLTREHLLTCRPIKRHNALRDEMGRLLRYATLSHVWVEKSGYNANGQSCRIDLHCRNPFPGGALGPALPDLGIDVTVRTAQPPTTSQACIKEKRDYYTGFNHGKTLIVPAAMTTTGGFASSFVDLLGQLARCAEARGVYQPGLDEAFVPRWKGRFAALVHQMNADHIQRHFGGVCLRSS
ncbi:uncharacterized protein MONBRDRAFT_24994, partial [Monosiga brevicollis MX1]